MTTAALGEITCALAHDGLLPILATAHQARRTARHSRIQSALYREPLDENPRLRFRAARCRRMLSSLSAAPTKYLEVSKRWQDKKLY